MNLANLLRRMVAFPLWRFGEYQNGKSRALFNFSAFLHNNQAASGLHVLATIAFTHVGCKRAKKIIPDFF
jgi:hypothetical protein